MARRSRWLVLLVVAIAISWSGYTLHAQQCYKDIVVTGAGSSEINGTYEFTSILYGMPCYYRDTTAYIYMNPVFLEWRLILVDVALMYTNPAATATPPSTGWELFSGVSPAPSLSGGSACEILVFPTSGLTTTEAGGTATFSVVLDHMPNNPVGIGISSDTPSEGIASPDMLVFEVSEWNVPQTVTVTGVDDDICDADIVYTIVTAAALGGNYAGIDPADVSVTNTNDDTPGITLSTSSGLTTSESGGTASFTITLDCQPTEPVSVEISSSDTDEGTVSSSLLVFQINEWDNPQTVSITGVDDDVDDGDRGYTIHVNVPNVGDYIDIEPVDVGVTNTDNDIPGVSVTPTSGIVTTEAGGHGTFTVTLDCDPESSVSISLSSSNPDEGVVAPSTISFTSADWSDARTVTVTGVDDAVDDGDAAYTIILDTILAGNFAGIDPEDVLATNVDNDTRGITVSPVAGLKTTEAGGIDTFSIVLDSEPTDSVSVEITSNDETEGTVLPPIVTFTPSDWDEPWVVTVTGVDDLIDDGDVSYTIETSMAEGGDYGDANIDPDDVSVTNSNNDTVGPVVSGICHTNIAVSGAGSSEVNGTYVNTGSLYGKPAYANGSTSRFYWNQALSEWMLVLTGVAVVYRNSADTPTPPTTGWELYSGAPPAPTLTGGTPCTVLVTPTEGLITTEDGATTCSFQVALDSLPSNPVSIGVSSSDASEGRATPSSLTFTASNWSEPQTVTIVGVDDNRVDGDIRYSIITAPAAGGNYSGIDPADVSVTNIDDDAYTVLPSGELGSTGILDKSLPDGQGGGEDEDPPMVGLQPLAAIYEVGEAITGDCAVVDANGLPVLNLWIHVFVYSVDIVPQPEIVTLLDHWVVRCDRSSGLYCFDVATDDLASGYYDIYLSFSDGSSQLLRVQLNPLPD